MATHEDTNAAGYSLDLWQCTREKESIRIQGRSRVGRTFIRVNNFFFY